MPVPQSNAIASYNRAARVVYEIESWNKELSIQDRNTKYTKLIQSPFLFFRGTNHLYWMDFSRDWRLARFGNAGTRTWIVGDAHVENFGTFHNVHGDVTYGLNDFDDSIIADYQYDVWRLAASMVLASTENQFSKKDQKDLVYAFAESYLKTLFKQKPITHFTTKNTYGVLKDFLKRVEKKNSRQKMLSKWTVVQDNERRFNVSTERLDPVSPKEKQEVTTAMEGYGETLTGQLTYNKQYFEIKDIARRLLAGTGSLGSVRYYVLIEGEDETQSDDHILDIKAQSRPTPYYFLSTKEQEDYDRGFKNDLYAHTTAYQTLTPHADNHLGWITLSSGNYSVRERSPFKDTLPTTKLTKKSAFMEMQEQWGRILASSHSRASESLGFSLSEKVAALTGKKSTGFQGLVWETGYEYANRVEADWRFFKQWYETA